MDTTAEEPIFAAELRPHRSLGQAGLKVVVGITFIVALINGIFFMATGAWPIAFFVGLDVALLYGALWLSYRSGRARENVVLSRDVVMVRKVAPSGREQVWRDNPFFSRFHVSRHDEFGITGMHLSGRSGRTDVGSFLNPDDRESFAAAFASAFATVKRRL